MRLRNKDGNGQYGDVGAIIVLSVIVFVMGLGILYLGERVHAPEQTRMFVTGPPDPPIRIE